MAGPIDLDRCRRGMKQISIEGTPRPALIAEAIERIQRDPKAAMAKEYLGIKNYASFGDQREDHQYGYGPKHGSIVFSIGRADEYRGAIDADAIYLLEACRDFGTVQVENRAATCGYDRMHSLNLCGVIRRITQLDADRKVLTHAIDRVTVETHEVAVRS